LRAARLLAFCTLLALLGACASLPAAVRREIARTPPGKVTVVRFVDFECPFCRRAHVAMTAAWGKGREDVRVVNKHVPLSFHKHAAAAARASICAERLGTPAQAEAVDDALYAADPDALDAAGIAALLEKAGVPPAAECMASTETTLRIKSDGEEFDQVGGEGVPLVWVGETRLEGLQSADEYRAALRKSLEAASGSARQR
jgi:protein-disulfide isomerase